MPTVADRVGAILILWGSLLYMVSLFAALVDVFIGLDGKIRPVESQAVALLHIIVGLLLRRRNA